MRRRCYERSILTIAAVLVKELFAGRQPFEKRSPEKSLRPFGEVVTCLVQGRFDASVAAKPNRRLNDLLKS